MSNTGAKPQSPPVFGRLVFNIGCILLCALMLLPIFLSLSASLKAPSEANLVPPTYFPSTLSLANYAKVFSYQAGLFTYVWNSLFTALISIILCLALSIPAGFGLARYQFPFKEGWFLFLLATMMLPFQALLIPLYLMFAKLGIANTHIGLAIVHTVIQLPFSIYLMRNSFESVPREIEDASYVDGCRSLLSLRKVMLPLVMPGIVTVALFAFINSWNEFLAALIFMNKEQAFTVPILLVSVRTGRLGAVDWGALQAGVILSIIPCILIYILLQRYYVSGLLSGAVK
jgi:multiple sugar transport system permease protein